MISTGKMITLHGAQPKNYHISADKTVNKMPSQRWLEIVFLVLNISQETEKRLDCKAWIHSLHGPSISLTSCQLSNIKGLT